MLNASSNALSSVYVCRVCLFGIRNNTSFGSTSTTLFESFVDVGVAAFKLSFPFLVHLISHSVIWKLKMYSGRLGRRRWKCSERFQHVHASHNHGQKDRVKERVRERERESLFIRYKVFVLSLLFMWWWPAMATVIGLNNIKTRVLQAQDRQRKRKRETQSVSA